MFGQLIKDSFPQDERAGLYRVPNLPAVKLGKILRKDTRVASPADVLAMHVYSSVFSSGTLLLTASRCYYEDGEFALEDVKEFQVQGNDCTVMVNQKGQFIPHRFSVKNEQVARTLQKVFEHFAYYDPESEALVKKAKESYEAAGYQGAEIDWLNLRDEIMRTIDMLYARYNDGKLSLLEYEEKKSSLLDRL